MKRMILIMSVFILGFSITSKATDYVHNIEGVSYKSGTILNYSSLHFQIHLDVVPTYYEWTTIDGMVAISNTSWDFARIIFTFPVSSPPPSVPFMFKYYAVYPNGDTVTAYVSGVITRS